MKYFVIGLFMGLIAGVVIATSEPNSNTKQTNYHRQTITETKSPSKKLQWRTASLFPNNGSPSGASIKKLINKINFLAKTKLELKLYEPGSLVPEFSSFDAVSSGRIEAAVTNPTYLGEKSRGFELFGGFPFGPDAKKFLAWYQIGGGKKLSQNLYRRYNIHGLICGITGPWFGGWFREPVNEISDLRKKRIATVGPAAAVLSRAGAKTALVAPQNIRSAMEAKKIFGTTIGVPYVTGKTKSKQAAGYIYFPGWHQQYNVFNLIINHREWDSLTRKTKKKVEIACTANIVESISQSEGRRFGILKSLVDHGFIVGRWPPQLLNELKLIWQKEVKLYRESDGEIGQIWRSLEKFSKDYSIWQELGYL